MKTFRGLVLGLVLLLTAVGCTATLPEPENLSSAAFGWPDAGLGLGASSLTLGDANEISGPIALQHGDTAGAYAWGGPTGFERPGDAAGFYPYSTAAQLPQGGSGFLRWRAINPIYRGDVFIPGSSTYFAVEYKDNLISPRLNPRDPRGDGPSVYIGTIKLGELEAKRDHRWKRIVFAIPAGAVPESDGRYRIEIGGIYGFETFGSALFHRFIAAKGPIPARASVAGFWPRTTRVLTNDDLFDRTGKPYVPLIVNLGSAGDLNQMDALTLVGANTNLAVGSAEGCGCRSWAPNDVIDTSGTLRLLGVPNTMAESKARGYYAVPWVPTDTWRDYIENLGVNPIYIKYGGPGYAELYDGTWRGVTKVWEKALRDLVATNPNVPFIYLKDEWDHEDSYWGSLEEQVVELRSIANRVAPGVPTAVTAMGWKPLTHQASYDLADILLSDRYPSLHDLQEVAEWGEEMRRSANGKPFMGVVALTNEYDYAKFWNKPVYWNKQSYLRSATYMSLIHGGKGMWWFGEIGGASNPAARTYYASLKAVTREFVFLADVLHGSATELGRTVASTKAVGRVQEAVYPLTYNVSGDGTSSRDGVATSYRQSSTRKVLLSVNEWQETLKGVRLNVSTIKAGDTIRVLFENRTITATQDGSFTDMFTAYQRHVYLIP